ncbi:discoidin domain-containing protein, partial [Verrucomicrobia bacterium]|nr:discoidin domain-containing protein [Verrucomicrobiota bacterium]
MLTAFVQAATVEFTAATSSVAEDDAAHTLTVRLNQAGGAALANPVVVNVADAGTGSAGTNTGPCAPTATNVAPSGVASQTSDFQGGVPQNIFPASNALDGNLSNITHTEGRANETDPSWEVDLLAVYSIERIKFYNRSGGWKQRMRDITVTILASDGTTELWNSGLLNPENILNSPDSIEQNIVTLNGSAVGGQIVRIHRTPDPDHSGGTLVGQADSDHG